MSNRFVISDTHFSHRNSWEKFKLPNGDPLRPFTSTEEMDEAMVERWNAKVGPHDVVYHLGDVAIARKGLEFVKRLNGKKRLVRGNHDIFKDQDYRDVGFDSLYGVRVFTDQFILSHIPLHPDSITDRFRACIHGHLHANRVMKQVIDRDNPVGTKYDGSTIYWTKEEIDPRYYCVSVEHTDYAPLSFEEVEQRLKKQWDDLGYTPPENSGWGNGSNPS